MNKSNGVPTRLQNLAISLLLAGVSALMALAGCELILRYIYPQFGVPIRVAKLYTEYDEELGWKLRSDFTGFRYTEGHHLVHEKINSRGYRGPEYPYSRSMDTYRIVILGDSFSEGYTVNFYELFSEVLRRELAAFSTIAIEAINLGVGGYSTDQELLLFRSEGIRYQPDLVVLMFVRNDLRYNIQSRYSRGLKPRFEVVDGNLVLKETPGLKGKEEWEQWKAKMEKSYSKARYFKLRKPDTWYTRRLMKFVYYSYIESTSSVDIDTISLTLAPRTLDHMETTAQPTAKIALTGALLKEIRDEAEKIGSDFLVFFVPPKKSIYSKKGHVLEVSKKDGSLAELMLLAQGEDIDFIDPLSEFTAMAKELAKTNKRTHWRKDPHWNVEGNELVGKILAEAIKARFSHQLRSQ